MSDELARPKIVLEVEYQKAIAAFVQTGEATKDLGKAIESLSKQLDVHTERSAKSEASIKRLMSSISGEGATGKFNELAEAVNRLGGVEKLTATQTEQLAKQMERLKAAGGTVPASLQGVSTSANSISAAFGKLAPTMGLTQSAATQAAGSMQGLAGSLGPVGPMIGALGPLGLIAAAGLAAAAAAAGLMVKTLTDAAGAAVAHGSRISDLSARLDFSVTTIQKFDYAAKLVGSSVESMAKAAKTLDQNLVGAPEKFTALGLSANELRKLAPEDQFVAVADALSKVDDRAQRNVLSAQLLGKSWRETAAILKAFSGGAGEAAERRGVVMSPETLANLDAVDDAMTGLDQTWEHFKMNIGAAFVAAPGLAQGIESLADLLGLVSKEVQGLGPTVAEYADLFGRGITETVGFVEDLNTGLKETFGTSLLELLAAASDDVKLFKQNIEELRQAVKFISDVRAIFKDTEVPDVTPRLKKGTVAEVKAPVATVAPATAADEKALDRAIAANIKTLNADQTAANAATAMSIKLTQELASAQAALGVGLDATLGKIRANTEAKVAEINANDKWNATTKAGLVAQAEAVGKAQADAAQAASAHKMAAEAAKVRADTEEILNKTLEAGMTALEVSLRHIEAKRAADVAAALAVVAKADAEKADTTELAANTAAKVLAINAAAEGEAIHQKEIQATKDATEARQQEAASTAIVNKFQKEYATLVDKNTHSLTSQIDRIVVKRRADTEAAYEAFKAGKITAEAYEEAIDWINKATEASIKFAKIQSMIGTIKSVGEIASQLSDLASTLGVGGKVGDLLGSVEGVTNGIGALADGIASKDPVKIIKGGIQTLKGAFEFGKKLFSGPSESEKIAKDVARDFGVNISEELAKTIEKEGRGRMDGPLMHLGEMISEAGGLEKFGAGRAAGAMRDLFSAVDRGTVTLEEAGGVFDETFGEVAASQVSKTTGIASAQLRELILLAKDFGLESVALREFMKGQGTALAGNLAGGLASLKTAREAAEKRGESGAGIGLKDQGAATAVSNAIMGDFAAMQAAGMSTAEAMSAIAPAVAAMRAELTLAGLEGGASFAALEERIRITTDAVTGPLITGVGSFAASLVNLHNMNLLTAEDFAGITAQIGSNILALEEQGVKGPAAAQALQPDLQKIWELQQATGFAVDETTQNLLDQAVEAGIVGEAHKSAADKMADASERTAKAVEFLAARFGYLADEMNKVPSEKNIRVNTEYSTSGSGVPPGGGYAGQPEGFSGGSDGFRNFGTQTPVFLHGMEAVITPSDFRSIASTSMMAGAQMMARGAMRPDSLGSVSTSMAGVSAPAAGPSGIVGGGTSAAGGSIVININGANKDPKQIADEVAYVLTRGRSPALLDEIRKRART